MSNLGRLTENAAKLTGTSPSSAAPPPWRQFPFFDASPVKDVHDLSSTPDIFKATPEISTISRSTAGVLVADIHGSVHLLNRDFESTVSWVAHVGGRVTHMVERRGVLVTLGEEDGVRSPLLKIWDLQIKDKKTGAPLLLRSTKVQLNNRPHPVTTVALSETLSHLAIGLGDGTVVLYRHLDQSLASTSGTLTSLPKARTVFESPTEPITGLGFREPILGREDEEEEGEGGGGGGVRESEVPHDLENPHVHSPSETPGPSSQAQGKSKAQAQIEDPPDPHHYLFITTTARVLCAQVSGRGSGGAPGVVDEVGAALGCAVMDRRRRNVVVAREEAIYVVGVEGRGACYAYEGHKSSIHTHASYLLIVSPPFLPTSTSASATVRNHVARTTATASAATSGGTSSSAAAGGAGSASGGSGGAGGAGGSGAVAAFGAGGIGGGGGGADTEFVKLTIFDPENKLVAYSDMFREGVRGVWSQWGDVWVLGSDGGLTRLQEKPTSEKLDMLYRKSLFGLALSLAATQKLDAASVADIHRQYGDALYAKGDYDAAMGQYLRTIGYTQASYVIRKYLDAQRIHNLVTYLQELHALGLANADHTTLLLNTYTKLKDVARLDSFIKTESRPAARRKAGNDNLGTTAYDPDELPFDLTTAIRVCRQAGYFEHASYLAKKYERHEDYLRIQIEDAGKVGDALAYLRRLGPEAAENNLARYGRAMLDALPEETTQLLIDLCTTTGPLDDPEPTKALSPSEAKPAAPAPSYLSYLALNRDRGSTSGGAPTVGSGDKDKDKDTRTVTPPSPSIKTVRGVDRDNASTTRGSLYEVTSPINTTSPPPSAITVNPPPTATSIIGPGPGSARQASVSYPQQPPEPPKTKRLSPRIYFPHFVEHMEQFVVFLETVALRRWGQSVEDQTPGSIGLYSEKEKEKGQEEEERVKGFVADDDVVDKMDQVAVWNTLLELYLTLPLPAKAGLNGASNVNGTTNGTSDSKGNGTTSTSSSSKPFNKELMREKAMRVLRSSSIPYDANHALILCSTHRFTDGLVLLWEKLGMYEDVLRFWMEKDSENDPQYPNASRKVIEHLMYYGQEKGQKHLYPLVLRFLTSTPELLSRHQEDVKGILEVVEEEKLMPPLGVVQVLSRNGVASVGLVKDWLVRRIKESREEIQNDQALIKSYRLETAAKLKQVKDLSNTEEPRVFHVTRCSTCLGQLDLPSVHFMCNHSYHQRCIADNETECPACAREHAIIREIRINNRKLADQHDVFLAEVQESGFEAVAAAFSRGLLNSPTTGDAAA